MAVLRGGVIGFGGTGQKMTEFINERGDAKIVAACNRGADKLAIAREKFGLRTTHDAEELCNWDDIDFVLVVSTSYAHKDQVIAAAKAGKHVFCEKPIALTLEDADAMIAEVEKAGVINVVNYSIRYIDAYIKIKQMHEEGKFGDILSIWTYRTRGWGLHGAGAEPHRAIVEPEESGGWTVHHACHDLDFIYWVNGPIKSVYGQQRSTVTEKESEEVVMALVTFENGAMGWVGDSVCQMRDHYTGVIGTRGQVVLTGEHDHTHMRYRAEGEKQDTIIPARDRKRPGGGLDHFIESIQKGAQSPISIRDARHSLACALSVQQSARTGQVVEVPAEPPSSFR
ncbi:Gfo/Idh/MocA family oxidoreductase [Candidatus Sumerlaeota bacterium]|nr:Gfo/Idh/MocA family oxidoreductase [Candidatus Sumerlaeota bacterium]